MKTIPLMISNSEIQTWKDCRRRWWLTYYRELGLKQELGRVGPLPLGTKVHLALCGMYEEGVSPVDRVNEIYAAEIADLQQAQIFEKITDLQKEQDLAKAMLEGYVEWAAEIAIDSEYDMIAPEETIEVPSGVPQIHLRGRLDQRMQRRSDGARLFRDFKTTASIDQSKQTLYLDEQMKFYHLLEQLHAAYEARVNGDLDHANKNGQPRMWRTDGALYLMLRKVKRTATAKPPFYEQVEVRHNRANIRSMWMRVHKVIEEIWAAHEALDAGSDHHYICPPRPSRDCSWKCDFLPICGMLDDGSNVEGLLNEYYEHRDPHERYADDDKTKGQG